MHISAQLCTSSSGSCACELPVSCIVSAAWQMQHDSSSRGSLVAFASVVRTKPEGIHLAAGHAATLLSDVLGVCRCKQTVRWVIRPGQRAWELLLPTAVHQMGLANTSTKC